MSQFITGDICMSQKISVLNEAKQNYVKIKSEALRKISSQKYCEISFKFLMKFALLFFILRGMDESWD
jgi:hypothetical protein